jgi:hypothetical protein
VYDRIEGLTYYSVNFLDIKNPVIYTGLLVENIGVEPLSASGRDDLGHPQEVRL